MLKTKLINQRFPRLLLIHFRKEVFQRLHKHIMLKQFFYLFPIHPCNLFFQGQEVDILQPGKPSFTATLERLYNQDREPLSVAPHAEMIVYWETGADVPAGAYLRVKKSQN